LVCCFFKVIWGITILFCINLEVSLSISEFIYQVTEVGDVPLGLGLHLVSVGIPSKTNKKICGWASLPVGDSITNHNHRFVAMLLLQIPDYCALPTGPGCHLVFIESCVFTVMIKLELICVHVCSRDMKFLSEWNDNAAESPRNKIDFLFPFVQLVNQFLDVWR